MAKRTVTADVDTQGDNRAHPETFESAVFVQIADEWICVTDIKQANTCLVERFPTTHGPSWERALAATESSGRSASAMVRATFIVAAMEAGLPFETFKSEAEALERRIEIEAENGLRSILAEDVGP